MEVEKQIRAQFNVRDKEFSLADLFKEIKRGNISKQKDLIKDHTGTALVVQNDNSNGFEGYYKRETNKVFLPHSIVVGRQTGIVYYQPESFMTTDGVLVLESDFISTYRQGLYIATVLERQIKQFGYTNTVSAKKLKKINIILPIHSDNSIAVDYMEAYIKELEAERIKELEAERIKELEAYLTVTGLNDYILTEEEREVLELFRQDKIEWSEYEISELFAIHKTLSFNKNKLTVGTEFDYVTRTSQNQGILQMTGFVNKDNINESGTWSLGLLQMDFFYRERPWYAGQFIRKIISKIPQTRESVLYFTSVFNKLKPNLSSVLVRNINELFLTSIITLPTKNNKPDYHLMSVYISAIQKSVIKDVVLYADRKINATKKVVENKKYD